MRCVGRGIGPSDEGPVSCLKHYCLPPLERFDLDEILNLIASEKYFLLHAPRQTGKTSSLLALMAYLILNTRVCLTTDDRQVFDAFLVKWGRSLYLPIGINPGT
jgi:hypothetical protein